MQDSLYDGAGEYTRNCLDELFHDSYSFLDDETEISSDYLHTYPYHSFAEGLTEYIIAHGYAGDPDSVSEKTEHVVKKCTENGVTINRTNIRHWFEEKRPISGSRSRELVYQLCFGLGASLDEVAAFFMKVYFECPFNYRDHKEAIYYFCFLNGLKYSAAQELIQKAEHILEQHSADELASEYTRAIGSALKNIHSVPELLSYIDQNSQEFFHNSCTAQEHASRLIDEACCLAVKMYDLESAKIAGKKLNRRQNIDFLLFQLLGADILGYKGEQSFSKAAELPDTVRSNFPLKMQLSNIRSGKPVSYETMRKALILLNFYSYFASLFYDNRDDRMFCSLEEDFRGFVYEINDLLTECGYPVLYVRNPFDWLIMHCAFAEYPLDEFKSAIERYYVNIVEEF